MTSKFEIIIPSEVIEYYEGEANNVVLGLIKYIKIRREDLPYFDYDKELFMEFVMFIINRIKASKNLDLRSLIHLIQSRLKFPGEY